MGWLLTDLLAACIGMMGIVRPLKALICQEKTGVLW
jgi:hypothetical protein